MADGTLTFDLTQSAPSLSFELENAHIVTVPIDTTLTEEGAAADAKAVGDRFADLDADDIAYGEESTVGEALELVESDIGDIELEISGIEGDITDLQSGKVDNTVTVNGHALSDDVTVTKSDIGLENVDNTSDLNKPVSTAVQNALDEKVDVEAGKGLSANDYTNADKTKLDEIEEQANKTTIISNLTTTTAGYALDAVQGKLLNDGLTAVDTHVSQIDADIAIVENGSAATHNITSGQYVLWNQLLYKATVNISVGTTLSTSNLSPISNGLGGEIKSLSDTLNDFGQVAYGDNNTATISVPNNSITVVSTITLPTKGLWLIIACADWQGNASGYRQISFANAVNPGRSLTVTSVPMTDSSKQTYQQAIRTVYVDAGSTIEVFAQQTSGSTLSLYPFLYAVKLHP